jgi:acyl-CoA reductase-like NAD-dependent aldehyde dehydrogenase
MFRRSSKHLFLWGQDFSNFVSTTITKNKTRSGNFIANEFLPPVTTNNNKPLYINNPSSDENISSSFQTASESIIKDAVSCAYQFQHDYNNNIAITTRNVIESPEKRSLLLQRLASFLEEDIDTIAKAESLNTGIAIKHTIALLHQSIAWIRFCANWCSSLSMREQSKSFYFGSKALTTTTCYEFQPIGVVAVLSSAVGSSGGGSLCDAIKSIAPALAAGNSVIWKPSEYSPLSSVMLGALIKEAEFPSGMFSIVQGTGEVEGQLLAQSPRIQAIAFSGRAKNASSVKVASAQTNFKSVIADCEDLPCVVISKTIFNDDTTSSSLQDQALDAAMLAFKHASGQGFSSSPKRLLLQEEIAEKFLQRLVDEKIKMWRLGHALDPSVDQGPMLTIQAQQNFLDQVVKNTTHSSTTTGKTAELVFGGFAPKFPGGHFVTPTCLVNVDTQSPLWRDFTPGPLLCVSTFKRWEDAVTVTADTSSERESALGSKLAKSMKSRFGGTCLAFSASKSEVECMREWQKREKILSSLILNPVDSAGNAFTRVDCRIPSQRNKISGNAIVGGEAAIVEQYCQRRIVSF